MILHPRQLYLHIFCHNLNSHSHALGLYLYRATLSKMRLFCALFRRKHMPNGHIYRGKDRIVKPVTLADVTQLKNSWEIEEKNMFLLRHSYLTPVCINHYNYSLKNVLKT